MVDPHVRKGGAHISAVDTPYGLIGATHIETILRVDRGRVDRMTTTRFLIREERVSLDLCGHESCAKWIEFAIFLLRRILARYSLDFSSLMIENGQPTMISACAPWQTDSPPRTYRRSTACRNFRAYDIGMGSSSNLRHRQAFLDRVDIFRDHVKNFLKKVQLTTHIRIDRLFAKDALKIVASDI